MRHATERTLDTLEPLLERIRGVPGLREKSRGVFYRKSKAFLHFHEDPTGLFADVRLDGEWQRLPINSDREQRALVLALRHALK